MQESIFTKIIKGEIPCHKIYEDDRTIAFLDIHATVEGHVLVVPKAQVDHLWDLEDGDYNAVMTVCKKIAVHLRSKLDYSRVGVKVVGEEAPHAHVHLIPFNTMAEFNSSPDESKEPDHSALAGLADRLKF